MTASRAALAPRLGTFYAAAFLFAGFHLPFWPAWLASRGMGEVEIGLLLGAWLWVRVLSGPAIAQAADRHGGRKALIVAGCAGSLVAALFYIPVPSGAFIALFAVTAAMSMANSAILPLTENLAMLAAARRGLDYGRVRLWGSVTFIGAALLGGQFLVGRSDGWILWLVLGSLALTLLASLALPDIRPPPAPRLRAPFRLLLTNRPFLVFLLCASMSQASHAVYYGFSTLHWRAAGHSEGLIGALWAEGVVAEIVLFFGAGALIRRFGPLRMLAAAGLAGVLRWGILGLTVDPVVLFAVNGLHAFTFGAAHLAAIHFIAAAVPTQLSATAQSIYSSLAMGALMALAMMGSGWLYAAVGGLAFWAMAALSLVTLASALWLCRRVPEGDIGLKLD